LRICNRALPNRHLYLDFGRLKPIFEAVVRPAWQLRGRPQWEMHMRRSSILFLLSAGALFFVWSLFGFASGLAQEAQEPESQVAEEAESEDVNKSSGETSVEKRERRPLLPGSTPPPTDLRWVRDHWTPWSPPDPESFSSDAVLHIIVRGDTLWDLADLAFGDPYLWPQIWNQNRYILDSHWIYPGDPLLLPRRPTVVTEVVPRGQQGAPPMPPVPEREEQDVEPIQTPLAAATPEPPMLSPAEPSGPSSDEAHAPRVAHKPLPLAGEVDIRCGGYIAKRDKKPDYFIANQQEHAKVGLTEGDIIYLNRGKRDGHVDPGTEYSVVVRHGTVYHPVTGKRLGAYYKRLGTVTVIMAHEDTAIGKISMACDEIRTGYDLVSLEVKPLPADPVPEFDSLDVLENGKPTGYIVYTMDHVKVAGTGYIVEIDLGYEDGLEPGDYLTIYLPINRYDGHRVLDYDYMWSGFRVQSPEPRIDKNPEFPRHVIGQLIVLTTEPHTATTKIIHAIREIEVGNMVEIY
jgi:hypothetical protein